MLVRPYWTSQIILDDSCLPQIIFDGLVLPSLGQCLDRDADIDDLLHLCARSALREQL
jgi:hypothetical protein